MTNQFFLRLVVVSLITCTTTNASGQALVPSLFHADSAHFAAPYAMDALFINTYDKPLRYYGASCPNASDGQFDFFVAATGKPFADTTIAAGDSIELRCRLVSFSQNVSMGCGMNFRTDSGAFVSEGQFGVSGTITKFYRMTSSREVIEFWDVEVGGSKIDSVVFVNTGNGIAQLYCGFRNSEFRLVEDEIVIIDPGDSVTLHVAYEPTKIGAAHDNLIYSNPFPSSLPSYFDVCLVYGNGVPRTKGLTQLEQAIYLSAYSFETPDIDTSRYVCTQQSEIVSARLVHGTRFTIDHVSLPTAISPPNQFSVVVSLLTDSIGWFVDTLLVTTADDEVTRVIVHGSVLVTDVSEDVESGCVVYPNPSEGMIQWCGKPLDRWIIVNSVGEEVARGVAGEDGNCRSLIGMPGMYILVSSRSTKAVSIVVLD